MANPNNPVPNLNAPVAAVMVDPVTGAVGGADFATYTLVNTTGTTTIATNRTLQGGAVFGGIFYDFGTAWTVAIYDIVGTVTNKLNGTATGTAQGQVVAVGPAGIGVRFLGNLVVVTTGTAGGINILWD